jgi:uncharacterized protein YifN (PemK superfamily)
VRRRIERTHGRPLRFEDVLCCEFNVYQDASYFDKLAPPELRN